MTNALKLLIYSLEFILNKLQMPVAIKKENIIDMPDHSDMIGEAMKEVRH